MTTSLVVSTVRVAGATVVTLFLQMAVVLVTARILGPGGRGVLVLVVTTTTFAMLISSCGIPIPARIMLGAGDRQSILGAYLGLGLLLSSVQVLLTMVLVGVIVVHSGIPLSQRDYLIAGTFGGCALMAHLLVHGLYGLGLNGRAASTEGIGALTQLTIASVLGVLGVRSVWPYLVVLLCGTLSQIAASLFFVAHAGCLVRPRFSRVIWVRLVRSGIPSIGLSLGQALVLRIDRVFVGLLLSATAVGIYSVAATASEAVVLAPTALSQVLFHRLASRSVDRSSVTRARLITLGFSATVAAMLFVAAPVIINGLFGVRFAAAVEPLRILLVAAVALASYQLDAYSLAALGRIGLAATASVIGLLIVVICDLLLIPARGIVGAAWASVIAYGSMAAVVRILMSRVGSQQVPSAIAPP